MSVERPIYSVHIPKTAGTTLRDFYRDIFGADHTYFYYPHQHGLYRADQDPMKIIRFNPFLQTLKNSMIMTVPGQHLFRFIRQFMHQPSGNNLINELPADCMIIHGHFNPDRFIEPNKRLTTVFREPLARAASHYRWYSNPIQGGDGLPSWFHPGMSFEQFVQAEEMQNFQAKYIGRPLGEFEHIGTTEALDVYCMYFVPGKGLSLKHLNQSDMRVQTGLSEHMVSWFKEHNADDYKIYAEASNAVGNP
jgi:hypothetical protein